MKKSIFLICLCIQGVVWSQSEIAKTTLIDSLFPKVNLSISINTPENFDVDDFQIEENGVAIAPVSLVSKTLLHQDKPHYVLILIENLNQPDRLAFYKNTLIKTLENEVHKNIFFKVAVFDRVRENGTQAVFPLNENYLNDTQQVIEIINSINAKKDVFGNNKSADLHLAVYEGLTLLETENTPNKSLFLLSSGFNNKWSSHTSSESNKAFAERNNIRIHSLQFRIQGFEHHKLTDLVHATFGTELITNSNAEAVNFLQKSLWELPLKTGFEYQLEYNSSLPLDNNTYTGIVKVKEKQIPFSFKTPINKKSNNLIRFGIVAGVVSLILLSFFLFRTQKRQKEEKALFENQMTEKELEINELNHKTTEHTNTLKKVEKERLEAQQKINDEIKESSKISAMKSIGSLPTLYFSLGENNGSKSYLMNKSNISIGRSPQNDLVIDHPTVSRSHALLYFENDNYFIEDQNSTSGTFLNSKKVSKEKLSNQSVLTLGKIHINFSY